MVYFTESIKHPNLITIQQSVIYIRFQDLCVGTMQNHDKKRIFAGYSVVMISSLVGVFSRSASQHISCSLIYLSVFEMIWL